MVLILSEVLRSTATEGTLHSVGASRHGKEHEDQHIPRASVDLDDAQRRGPARKSARANSMDVLQLHFSLCIGACRWTRH